MPPLATVAMVTYKSARFVRQAIESVLCQSYENLELVICDDQSPDETWEIIQSFKDPRIRAVRNPSNLREYPNRNQAIEMARGEYLIFIDGDDILYPHGLEFMVRMLAAFPNSSMAMAKPWIENIIYPVEISPETLFQAEFLGTSLIGINFAHVLFRTNALRTVGGLSTKYRTGDTWVQLRIGMEHSSLLIPEGQAWWRRTPGQASEVILQTHEATAEYVRYGRELLNDPKCPLTVQGRAQAEQNMVGVFLRIVLRYLRKGKLAHSRRLLQEAGLSSADWKFLWQKSRRDHLQNLTPANPLQLDLNANPYSPGHRR